ncbi:ABC transporter substrate-binding protein [Elioraea rosea]|uniref:ABC transporter substrate-binding protein n=1 Tax=Elioraea rosea TaxID=2492390 RepID=UPI001EF5FF30|nr:ABC transporter substrate-binding protein [Elioraea rosea]
MMTEARKAATSALGRRTLLAASAAAPALMTLGEARAQGVAPRRGGVLNTIITPEPPVLILGVNNQGPTLIVASKIYQGLLTVTPSLDPAPDLAKSWTRSDDGLTYTFALQEGVKWHDGRDFTSEDVIFSIMKFHMEVNPRARAILQRIDKAEAPDAHTVRFTLKAPFEPFLLIFDVTACAMVPKHIYDGTDFRNNPANATPIGTGPFKFAEWQRGNFIRMVRNEQYWKPNQPYLDGITWRIVPDSQSRALALQTGQVQMTTSNDIEPFDVPRFQQQPNLTVALNGWEYFSPLSWIEINNRLDNLKDPRFRRAMAHAVDRNFIAQRLWFGVGKPATGPIASTTRFHDPSVQMPAFNPREANAILDGMGLRPNAQGVRASIKLMQIPYGEVWNRLSEYLRQAMRQVGIEVTLESTDVAGWVRRLAAWEFETTINFVYQWGDPTLGVERTYVTSNIQKVAFTNTAGYSNPEVDRLFEAARNAAQAEERRRLFSEAQKKIVEDMPLVWLMELAFPTIHDKRLNNVIRTGTGVHASFDDVFLSA